MLIRKDEKNEETNRNITTYQLYRNYDSQCRGKGIDQ